MGKVKPFRLTLEFTPAFGGNRERAKEDQFTVTLRDTSIEDKVNALDEISREAPDAPEIPKDRRQTSEEFSASMAANRKQTEWRKNFAMSKIVRVNGLAVVGADDKEITVETAADLAAHCPDVVLEVANRLLFGAGEEELKNSQSPSSAGSSATAASEPATSTAAATAS